MSNDSSLLCSIFIVFADGRERLQVKETPQWAAASYLKAFNLRSAITGNRAELRAPITVEGGVA